jgi:hypothetical protein
MVGSILTQMLVMILLIAVIAFVLIRVLRASGNAATAAATMTDPVPGTLLVTAAAMPSRGSLYHNTRITGVISGEGVEPTAVQFGGIIKTSLWPSPGKQLPVIVDRANPQNFAIQWDQVGSTAQQSLGQAEALAAAMRAKQDGPPA